MDACTVSHLQSAQCPARRQHGPGTVGPADLLTVEPGDAESRDSALQSALSDDQTALMDLSTHGPPVPTTQYTTTVLCSRLNRLAAATGHPHANGAEGVNDSGRVLFRVPSTWIKGDIFLSGQVRATSPAVWIDFLTLSPVARAEVPARQFKILQCETATASKLIVPSFPLRRPRSLAAQQRASVLLLARPPSKNPAAATALILDSTVVDFCSWFKLPDCPRPSFKAAVACARAG
nr:hypothetical protein B24B19.90 [imported] - Neurospora crassa [Neurospora crassa]